MVQNMSKITREISGDIGFQTQAAIGVSKIECEIIRRSILIYNLSGPPTRQFMGKESTFDQIEYPVCGRIFT